MPPSQLSSSQGSQPSSSGVCHDAVQERCMRCQAEAPIGLMLSVLRKLTCLWTNLVSVKVKMTQLSSEAPVSHIFVLQTRKSCKWTIRFHFVCRYAEELNALDNLLKELSLQPGFQEGVLIVLLMGIHCPAGDVLPLIPGGKPLKVRTPVKMLSTFWSSPCVQSHAITCNLALACMPSGQNRSSPALLNHCCQKILILIHNEQDLGVKGFDSVVRPQQSYEVAALDESCPNRQNAILCVQKLPYVIR